MFLIALESSHAIWEGVRLAKTLPKESNIVIVSGHFFLTFHVLTIKCATNALLIFSAYLAEAIRMSNRFHSCSLESGQTLWTGTLNLDSTE